MSTNKTYKIDEGRGLVFSDAGSLPLSCETCIHRTITDGHWDGASCAAFDEIPAAIRFSGRAHLKPVDGDKGTVYEPDMSLLEKK